MLYYSNAININYSRCYVSLNKYLKRSIKTYWILCTYKQRKGKNSADNRSVLCIPNYRNLGMLGSIPKVASSCENKTVSYTSTWDLNLKVAKLPLLFLIRQLIALEEAVSLVKYLL